MKRLVAFSRRAMGFAAAKSQMGPWLETSPEDISRHQLRRLRIIWSDVTTHVPFYRQLVNQNRVPRCIENLRQFFQDVPPLTKQHVLERPDLFVRTDRKADAVSMTGGSTGEPLRYGVFRDEKKPAKPDMWMGRIANGLEESDRIFLLWGHSYWLKTGLRARVEAWERRAKDFMLGYRQVSAYDLSLEKTRTIYRQLKSFSPALLIGHSAALDALVRDGMRSGFDGRELGLKFVVATSEVLPYGDSSRLIEDFFGCPLAMEYGGHDFGLVAHTLPNGRYRVLWPDMLAEIQPPDSDVGQALVTPLYRRYFPAIRYVTGDEIRNPILGCDGQVLGFSKVVGRTNDTIELGDGSRLHSTVVEDCVKWEPGVRRYQVVLEDGGVTIHLVGDPGRTDIAAIRKRMAKISPLLAAARIVFVEDTAATVGGKRRWVIDRRPPPA